MEQDRDVTAVELCAGRCFLGRLRRDSDLITAVEGFCSRQGIATGVFSIIGAVTTVTLGTYDQNQQVYVSQRREGHFEVVHCTGNVSTKDNRPTVHAHGVFADGDGHVFAGHVFTETLMYAGEVFLRELLGNPLQRRYDKDTGLYLWDTALERFEKAESGVTMKNDQEEKNTCRSR